MIGVIVGRFQVDEIHAGHLNLLQTVQAKHTNVLILLGCRKTRANRDNPLNYQMREQMLREICPNAIIMPVFDCQTDELWSRQVDDLIRTAFPGPATLYGGRNSFIPHYKGRHPTRQLDFGEDETDPSGSSRRKLVGSQVRNSVDFRAGAIYALMNMPPQVVPCVDVAVYRYPSLAKTQILLGRKLAETGWRLPGGMVDVTDPDYATTARRELFEETGMTCESSPVVIGSYAIDDWRLRGRPDVKYMSTLFAVPYHHGIPQAGDDLDDVDWFDLDKAADAVLIDHRPLITAVQEYLQGAPLPWS